jgi:hypothetical protein
MRLGDRGYKQAHKTSHLVFGGTPGLVDISPCAIQALNIIPPLMIIEFRIPQPEIALYEASQPPDGVSVSIEQDLVNIHDERLTRSLPDVIVVITIHGTAALAAAKWIWNIITKNPPKGATYNRKTIHLDLLKGRAFFEQEILKMAAEDENQDDKPEN